MTKDAVRTAIVLLAFGAAASGQTPVGPNFQVNTYTTGTQFGPRVGVEPDGDFVMVWSSLYQDGDTLGVFGQRFDASGAARGGEFQINNYTTGNQWSPDVAVGSAGDFVVVWTSLATSPATIQARRFDATGSPVGGEFRVDTYEGFYPQIARAADGRFVVSWLSAPGYGDVLARRFDSSGTAVGDEFTLNTSPGLGSDVAVEANGSFVVAWSHPGNCYYYACRFDVSGQRFDAAGNRVGNELAIGGGYTDPRPSAGIAPSGGFAVAWTRNLYGYQDLDVVATGVNGTVNTYTAGEQSTAVGALAHDGGGNFIVTWTSFGQDGDSSGVFGQRFDGVGNRIGTEFAVNTYTTGGQQSAVVGADAVGNFIVAWADGSRDGDGGGIFAQRFAPLPPASADIAVSITDSPDPVVRGANLAYTIVVTNNGPDAASGVQVALPTPSGLTFIFNSGACAIPFPCALGTVLAGQSRTITATYMVPPGYGGPNPIVATVTTTTTTADPSSANNQATAQTALAPDSADLAIFKLGPASVNAESDIVYSITVNSGGPSDAAGVQVADPTPVGLTFVSNSGSCTTPFPCALGTVPAGQNRVITARFHVPGGYSGPNPIVNQATVTATTSDPIGANNTDDVSTTFIPPNLEPASIAVDGTGDGVFQPNETVVVAPSWRNAGTATLTNVAGAASNFTGPPGPTYAIRDAAATYGTIGPGATVSCGADCYRMTNTAVLRPAQHWDTTFLDAVTPGTATKTWRLHIGDSFTDVLASSAFYRFVETIFHRGISGGCSATRYCPTTATTREQMAVFVLVAKEGAGYVPPACTTAMFGDVPVSSPFCRWVEELAHRGVVSGCGGGNYCPSGAVTREQMAVIVLRTLDPVLSPPDCVPPNEFTDVPETSPFCRWIEELARRGAATGCGSGNYCPLGPVTREQMTVFLSVTFGLTLYGP